jgi:uncharacterized membrane protein
MTPDTLLFGSFAAMAVMTIVTYLCRISGVALMGFVPLTPRVRRGLAALPGCIVVATVLPIADRIGPVAFLTLAASLAVMAWRRSEILALATGLCVVSALRAWGF